MPNKAETGFTRFYPWGCAFKIVNTKYICYILKLS